MNPTNLFDYRLHQILDPSLHPDCRQLLNYLFDENFACTGIMADSIIREAIKRLREKFSWNRIEVTEGQGELEHRVVEDNFLSVIFHLPEKQKFFCFKLGDHDRDFLYRCRSIKHYSDSDFIVALFRGANDVLEVAIYACYHSD